WRSSRSIRTRPPRTGCTSPARRSSCWWRSCSAGVIIFSNPQGERAMANKPPADDLSALLDSYDGAKVNPPDKSGAEDEWIEKFNAHRDKVIRPTMEQLG